MVAAKGTTKAELLLEANVQVSGPPMSGQWQIKCVYPDGAFKLTNPLNLDASSHTIQRHISEHCPFMRNRVLVHTFNSPYSHHTLGKEFYVDFMGYTEDPGQFEIVSSEENPLIGDITYIGETLIPYGKNLVFWPIPFEMLETYEEKPQMLVEIDDMPAVCHSMECEFTHIPAVGSVASFTFVEGTRTLTMTGTELPDNISKIQSITFAGSTCTISGAGEDGSLSGTEVVCVLDREPTCGTWTPALTTFLGNVPIAEGVAGQVVQCTITDVTPATDLNLLGQDNITFTGTNFPHEMEGNTFELTFTNGLSTGCNVVETKTTELICLTQKWDTNADKSQDFGMNIAINGLALTQSVSLRTKGDVQASQDITPNSASPVLKTPIVI